MTARRFGVLLASGALLLCASGCYKATFYDNPRVSKGEEHEQWTDFFVFGTVGTEHIDVKQFCPTGEAALVRTGGNVGTGLVGALTIGIYTPRKVYVTCAANGPARSARRLELDLSREGEPVNARLTDGEERIPVVIEAAGAHAWRMSRGAES
jgi:Bor protein